MGKLKLKFACSWIITWVCRPLSRSEKHLFSELGNYCIIYQFLVEHDKTMSLVLSENAIKTRMKKNVVTLAGHTTTFSVKLAILYSHWKNHSFNNIDSRLVFFQVQILWVMVWVLRVVNKKSNLGENVTEKVALRCFVSSLDGVLSILHIGRIFRS